MLRHSLIAIVILVLFLGPLDLLAQCAMCKAVVEGGSTFGGPQSVGKGLNTGILYLMAVPYVLLFLIFRKRIVAFFKELGGAQG